MICQYPNADCCKFSKELDSFLCGRSHNENSFLTRWRTHFLWQEFYDVFSMIGPLKIPWYLPMILCHMLFSSAISIDFLLIFILCFIFQGPEGQSESQIHVDILHCVLRWLFLKFPKYLMIKQWKMSEIKKLFDLYG